MVYVAAIQQLTTRSHSASLQNFRELQTDPVWIHCAALRAFNLSNLVPQNGRRRDLAGRQLFDRVEVTVGTAKVDDAIGHQRRGKDRADTCLLHLGHDRSFTPIVEE